MPKEWLQNDLTHIIGFSIAIFAMIMAAIMIKKFTKKYENMEIFWVPFFMIIGFVFGGKFL